MQTAEFAQVCQGFAVTNLQTAGAAGDWVSLRYYHVVEIVVQKEIGGSGENPALTFQQATDVSGTAAKTLGFTVAHVKEHATSLQSVGQFTKTAVAANSLTLTGINQGLYVVSFEAEDLDADGGFDCIRVNVSDPGGVTAQNAIAIYRLMQPRYAGLALPSAIVD